MTPRLFLRPEARAELAEAYRWYEERSTGLGHEFIRSVRIVLAAIERAPSQFPTALDDIGRAQLRRFPYLIYFVVLPESVSVLAVMHGRRDPRRWQARR